MPLISQASIVRSASNVGKNCPSNTSWGDFTSNLTHLHLESKGIRCITNLDSCYAVRVLYLYSNRIDRISGLENLRQLTHLYLQKNQVQRIQGLESLVSLQKLYLEDNEISCVENLQNCTALQELHLSRQRLPGDLELAFHPACLEALSGCLIRLAVQHCNIVDVSPLTALQQLQNLNLAGNEVQHVASIQGLIGSCPGLHTLDVRDNPLCSMRSYRKGIVGVAGRLQHLDGTPVLKQERLFLQRLHSRKLTRDASFRTAPNDNVARARNLLEAMPTSLACKQSSKASKGSPAAAAAASAALQPYQGQSNKADRNQDNTHTSPVMSLSQTGRVTSASSSDSDPNREGELPFIQAAVPNLPADQHALNDLSELRSRTGVTMDSPSMSDGGGARRALPSRTSSWSSSRAGSALLRTTSKLASTPEKIVEAEQLMLHGMSIV